MGRLQRICGPVATLALAVSVAGCGDDPGPDEERRTVVDSDDSPGAPIPEESAPADAYAAWIGALARRDAAAACALQAPEFTIELRYDAILVDRAELGDPCVDFEALLWEDPAFDSEIVDVAVTRATDEDAVLEVHRSGGAQTVTMTYHRAAWRVLRVERRAGSDSATARWLAAWCELDPSMTREQVVALMGAPSGEYTVADGGEPQLWWARRQYDFRVYLDVDGSVLELVGDYDALGAGDRASLPCPELRS
jgi:hypothetical protein